MSSALVMSTDPLALRERAPAWREWMGRHFGGLESDLYGDTSFDGQLAVGHAGDVILTHLEANRHRVLRTASQVRASEEGYLKIIAPQHGSAAVEQQGRRTLVGAGGWTIYDTTERYMVSNPERTDHLIVMVPKTRLITAGLPIGELMARHVGGALGISRVTLETLRSTWQELPNMSAASARGAGEMIMRLVHLSLHELAGQSTAHTRREALRDRVRQTIAQQLRDPGLNVDRLAELLGCSKRHLHNAYAGSGETLADSILRQRLEACMRDLRAPELATRPVTEIALSWGFNNVSHFSRVFRAHAGLSPSEWRAGA